MPGKNGHGKSKSRYVVFLVVIALVFGFSPISRTLLRYVHGSFAPSPYSSLSLAIQSDVYGGVLAGKPVAVLLTNHTGHIKIYHWSATQNGALISRGEKTLDDDQTTKLLISSSGAKAGILRIALNGTDIFVTATIRKSRL
jgi:hypothetical protein